MYSVFFTISLNKTCQYFSSILSKKNSSRKTKAAKTMRGSRKTKAAKTMRGSRKTKAAKTMRGSRKIITTTFVASEKIVDLPGSGGPIRHEFPESGGRIKYESTKMLTASADVVDLPGSGGPITHEPAIGYESDVEKEFPSKERVKGSTSTESSGDSYL
jgi:hypothetical protein